MSDALVTPDGWIIDEVAVDVLRAALTAAPDDLAGVVATGDGDRPAGSSYRVIAERRTASSAGAALGPRARSWSGVALVRDGRARVENGVVVADADLALVPAAYAHDSNGAVSDPPVDARPEGRPPFPRRPVVLFIGNEGHADRVAWATAMCNALVPLDVEARIATPTAPPGPQLTVPCAPTARTIQALRPEVVVALDESAGRLASGALLAVPRGVGVIFDPTTFDVTMLPASRVPPGRLRAVVGPSVDVATLRELLVRLSAGPHVLVPVRG